MGFFSKIWKGIKKVVNKVGKGIKSAFKSIGKFMNKIGIVGQIGLALVLPGIGQMLSAGLTGLGGAMAGYTGIGSTVVNAAGQFVQAAVEVGGRVGNFFSSVTDGVTKVVGETVGAAAKSLGVTPESFIGKGLGKVGIDVGSASWDSVWQKTQTAFTDAVGAGKRIFTGEVAPEVGKAVLDQAMGQTQDVSKSLMGKLDQGVVELDVPTDSLLSPVQVTAQKMPTQMPPVTFGDKVSAALSQVPERALAKAKEAFTDLPAQAVQAAGTKVLEATGLVSEPEYQYNQYAIQAPTIDMGSTTGIGADFATPDVGTVFSQYDQQYLDANPYGTFAQLMNLYPNEMKARGYA